MMMRSFQLPFSGSTGRGQSIRGSVISLLITILLSRSMVLVTPEIIDLGMDMIIDASSEEVHFIRGFLRAPASIDLSNIRWITNEAIVFEFGDDAAFIDDFHDDFFGDYLDETSTSEPTFFGSEIDTSVEEPFGDGDIPAGEEAIEEDEDSQGDVAVLSEEVNFDEDTKQEEDTVDEGAEGASTEEEEEEEEHDNDEAPDDMIPSIDKNIENEDTEGEGGEGADEDEVNENQADSELDEDEGDESELDEDEGDESETEGDENDTEAVTTDTQSDEDDKNDVNDESDGDVVEGADEDEVNENQADSKPDEDEGEESETEGDENNTEEVTPDAQSEEGDNNDVNDESDGDVGDNGNEQKSDEEDGETDTEGEENNTEEATTDVQSKEDDNKANDETDGDVGDNGNENNDGEGEEETESVEEDIDEEDPLPEQSDVEENDGNEGEDLDDQDGDQPVAEDADAEESTSSPEGDRNLQDFNQILDIVLFAIPENCEKDNWGNCDWVSLGVGSYDDEMQQGMSYCCSTDTAFRNVCGNDDIGTLMIDENIFDGFHRKLQVPSKPLEEFAMDDPVFDVEESGDYVLVIANCNDDGFGVITLGDIEWKSVGGYLPGTESYRIHVYGVSSAIFFVLGVWYSCGMRMFQETAIPIQKFILATIILGFLATAFLAIDSLVWNIHGTRSNVLMYIAFALQIAFLGLLRCLGVMVAMGWGVVRDTLGMALCRIIFLGLLYSGLSLVQYTFDAASKSAKLQSTTEGDELFDLAVILKYVIFVINVVFYCWIISSVTSTTEYLRNMNQTSKLRRHLRLRCLIYISLIIISSLVVVRCVQAVASIIALIDDISIFQHENEWIIEAVKYGNYLFIAFGVTILWRPNADAKDYAMQMEIATEEDGNDLQLSCVVPSADDADIGEGYKVDDAVIT